MESIAKIAKFFRIPWLPVITIAQNLEKLEQLSFLDLG